MDELNKRQVEETFLIEIVFVTQLSFLKLGYSCFCKVSLWSVIFNKKRYVGNELEQS